MADFLWWREGVIYQIYPRSFADGNGDGLGDLPGISAHLDYLAELGVEAIWLSPIQPSPDKDFGYDVSDYCAIDARFGTLEDFDNLLAKAHRLGLHVILDMVLNHTSDQHAWFKEARSSRENAKRDWYIWRARPNNWQAQTGGKAWEYDEVTGEYYLHLFTKEQPDVNWRNPELRKAMLEVFRFWLERGVDGFRLDVFNAYFKQAGLPDNPPRFGLRGFDRQRHIYDMDQPEMLPFLKELRQLLDAYPKRYAVGEPFLPSLQKAVAYCGPEGLQAAFSFDFTTPGSELAQALGGYPWNPAWILAQIRRREAACHAAGVWPTSVLSNHDLPRFASRVGGGEEDARARTGMALLLTLRGTPFLYYGEEIGIRDIHLRREEILDPPGQRYWPLYKGRDSCRAPMQWDAGPNAGFSSVRPWLPLHPDYIQRNVRAQQADPGSLYHFTKKLLGLRKQLPALRQGDLIPVQAAGGVLSYLRRTEAQTLLVAINFRGQAAKCAAPEGKWELVFSSHADSKDARGQLKPYEVRLLMKDK